MQSFLSACMTNTQEVTKFSGMTNVSSEHVFSSKFNSQFTYNDKLDSYCVSASFVKLNLYHF